MSGLSQSDRISDFTESTNQSESWSFLTFLRIKPPTVESSTTVNGPQLPSVPLIHQLEYSISADVKSKASKTPGGKQIRLEIPVTADPGIIHNNDTGFIPFDFNEIFDVSASQDYIFRAIENMISDSVNNGVNCTG